MTVIDIDGAYGEGGGQVLRTALALSAITGHTTHLRRIRAGRRKPGLAPQHLTAAQALARICAADMRGAEIGSTEVVFQPQAPPQASHYFFDVATAVRGGSAGSTGLIFQAVLFPLLDAGKYSRLTVKGGTHVAWSPMFEYLQHVYLPMITAMGVTVTCRLDKVGFYPIGGGQMRAEINGDRINITSDHAPSCQLEHGHGRVSTLTALNLLERGLLQQVWGVVLVCDLAEDIARRMQRRVCETLADSGIQATVTIQRERGPGRGIGVCLISEYTHVRAGFSALGERGKPAEQVADSACQDLLAYHTGTAPVDPHLADQLLLPMALGFGRSQFRTCQITQHLLTNAYVIRQFLPVAITIEGNEGAPGVVIVAHEGE